eukprot:GFUD01015112.1.p1 GENE.GFUD01015112.1~~GFUD01015112.1.p1  ORF type:complete len:140 (-),score=20.52 GFUD01015112.1:120-539(-)
MNLEVVNPSKSCGNGGRKVCMIFSSAIPVDAEPCFQLFNQTGQRLENMEYLLSQPTCNRDCAVLKEAIILIAPSQPNLDVILENEWRINLAARTRSDGSESRMSFEFKYVTHPLDNICLFCDLRVDGGIATWEGNGAGA